MCHDLRWSGANERKTPQLLLLLFSVYTQGSRSLNANVQDGSEQTKTKDTDYGQEGPSLPAVG